MKIRHLFTNGIVIVFLLLSLGSPSQVEARESNDQANPQNTGSTAVLFLIDESGGVSGRCAIEGQVLVTDKEEEFRYEFVRLFWWIWKEFYSGDWAIDAPPDLPDLYFGVAQFAKNYRETFPFRKGDDDALVRIDDLLDSPGGTALDGRLTGNGEKKLALFDDLKPCQTDYASALEEAGERLGAVEAEQRILVLITDGSFRGQQSREDPTSETKKKLRKLNDKSIQVNVLLLGSDLCRTSSDECGLTEESLNERNKDLDIWEGWENQDLVRLLDIERPFQSLAKDKIINSTLPSYRSGWVKQEEFTLPGSQDLVRLVVVSSQQIDSGNDPIQVDKDSNYSLDDSSVKGTTWRRDYKYDSPNPGNEGCPRSKWKLINSNPGLTHYYWIAPCNNTYLRLKPLTVQHNESEIRNGEISLNANKNELLVETGFPDSRCPPRPQCYQVKIEVRNRGGREPQWQDERILDFGPNKLNQRTAFDNIPDDLPWGSELVVSAKLVYKASTDNVLYSLSKHLSVVHSLSVVDPEVTILSGDLQQASSVVSIKVPIKGAAMLPDSTQPVFSLYPSQFSEDGSPIEIKGCALKYESVDVISKPLNSDHIINYRVSFPHADMWERRCGYRELLVQIKTNERSRMRHWVSLSDPPTPTPEFPPPPTPTPESLLPPTPTPESPLPPTLTGTLPVFVFIAIILAVILMLAGD